MNTFSSWTEALVSSMQGLWLSFVAIIPDIIGALLILIIGRIIARALGKFVKRIAQKSKIDNIFDKVGLTQELSSMGLKFTLSSFIGGFVKWFILLIVFMAVVDVLKLNQLNDFLKQVLLYIPNIFVAVIILALGFVAARLVATMVNKAAGSSHFLQKKATLLASVARLAIIAFAAMAALVQLGIAQELIQTLFTALVGSLFFGFALAFGIAFGLGGKDQASTWLKQWDEKK